MKKQKFVIEGRLAGINELMSGHWRKRYRVKCEGKDLVIVYARAARIRPVKKYPCEIHIQCFEPNMKRDDGNVKGGASKIILDALQDIEIIKNDGRSCVESFDLPVQTDRENPRIEVEIIEKD